MFGILERWNNNQVTPSLSKPHELSYRSNICSTFILRELQFTSINIATVGDEKAMDWRTKILTIVKLLFLLI